MSIKEQSAQRYHGDPLLDSLVIFSKLQSRPYTREALIAGLPVEDGRNTPALFSPKSSKSLFSRAASRAGFKTKLLKSPLQEINPLLLPCILLLNGKKSAEDVGACILLGFDDEMKYARIVLPEAPELENSVLIEDLEKQYYGFAFLLKKEIRVDEQELGVQGIKESHWFWGSIGIVKNVYRDVIIASFLLNFRT